MIVPQKSAEPIATLRRPVLPCVRDLLEKAARCSYLGDLSRCDNVPQESEIKSNLVIHAADLMPSGDPATQGAQGRSRHRMLVF